MRNLFLALMFVATNSGKFFLMILKHLYRNIHFLFLLALCESRLIAQEWIPLGLDQEKIYGLTMVASWPNRIICGTRATYSSSGSEYGSIIQLDVSTGEAFETYTEDISIIDFASPHTTSDTIFAALHTHANCSPGILKSTNGGLSWSWSNHGLLVDSETGVNSIIINPSNSSMMFTSTSGPDGGKAYRSNDGGDSWIRLDDSQESGIWDNNISAWAIDPFDSTTIYAGGTGSGMIFKSTDGGDSWSRIFSGTGLMYGECVDLQIDSSNPLIIFAAFRGDGVYKSTDGGLTWVWYNTGLTDLRVNEIFIYPENSDSLLVATWGGIFFSNDGAENWTSMNTGLDTLYIETLFYDQVYNTLYCGTHAGVYAMETQLNVHQFEHQVSCNWQIEQIYPNPFNPSTNIKVWAESGVMVTVDVIDIQGRIIQTGKEYSLTPGQNTIGVNIRELSYERNYSGVVFFRVSGNGFSVTKKAIIVK